MFRAVLHLIALGLVVLLLGSCAPGDTPRAPRNLVVIGIDTVRYDAFWLPESSAQPDRLSPHLERALRFRNARAPSPWTLPSVASLFTGQYPVTHGAGSYVGTGEGLDTHLPPPLAQGTATLASRLHGQGYATAAFVAQAFFHPRMGLRQGFERVVSRQRRQKIVQLGGAWVDGVRDPTRPFFLYLHLLEAHRDHMQGDEKVAQFASQLTPKRAAALREIAPAGLCDAPDATPCHVWLAYGRAVLGIRESIALVLDKLDERDLLDDTIVVVYSDHGEEFFEHQSEEAARGTNPRPVAGFGHGHAMYEELLHVPLVVWLPGHAGADVLTTVSLVDVHPTLEDWLGLDLAATYDGESFAGKLTRGDPDRVIFSSHMAAGPDETAALRGHFKRIVRTAPEERVLYDLANDPGEHHPTNADVAAELDREIAAYNARHHEPEAPLLASPDLVEGLRAIGYLESADEDPGDSTVESR